MSNIASKTLPAQPHSYTCKYDRADPTTADSTHQKRIRDFQSRQGSLQWLVTTGRYDIALAVKHAASVMSSPKPAHIQLHHRIYGYLRRTQDIVLTWDPSHSLTSKPNQLYYHTDGSYTGEGLQSRMGFVGSLNGGTVIADNQNPKFQCTGVFDVEEAAACWGAKDAIYRAALLTELGYPQDTIPFYCDNAATVLFSSRPLITSLNKHVAVRGAYTRELQQRGFIKLYSVSGINNVSDQQRLSTSPSPRSTVTSTPMDTTPFPRQPRQHNSDPYQPTPAPHDTSSPEAKNGDGAGESGHAREPREPRVGRGQPQTRSLSPQTTPRPTQHDHTFRRTGELWDHSPLSM